jgi:flavin reductase (DIM6/NTAB) family NADH-FMN oxidoreductase RutF
VSEDLFRPAKYLNFHRLLGPRTAFLVGTVNSDGSDHLCTASNVTNVGNTRQLILLALWPEWTTTANILRTGQFTLNLMNETHMPQAWIVGHRYSGVRIPEGIGKFEAANLTRRGSSTIAAAGVEEALSILQCTVEVALSHLSDHVLFISAIVSAECRSTAFDGNDILDAGIFHPLMQNSGARFASARFYAAADTDECNAIVSSRTTPPAAV